MTDTTDTLRGELERLFELDEMMKLSDDLLGLDPEQVGGTDGKGTFARALVERCRGDEALEALADAILLSNPKADRKLHDLLDGKSVGELEPGTEVGGYRIVKRIGEGGVGVVHLGQRREEGEQEEAERVAIKVVRPAFARDRSGVRRWLTAQRALRAVESRGLARVLSVGVLDDGRPWVATRFVEGQTLAARIGRVGPMHINEARPILRSLFDALEALHGRGLVHGDVKTENVFMVRPTSSEEGERPEPYGVLVDGGTDRLLARGSIDAGTTGAFTVFGTPKAIAPEVARGGALDPLAEIYALGAMLYEIVAGRPPFTGDSGLDVVVQHLTEEPAPPSEHAPKGWVARSVDEIARKALAKDPAERFQSIDELREAVESVGRVSREPSEPEQEQTAELDEKAFEEAASALEAAPEDEEKALEVERIAEPAGAWDRAADAFAKAAEATEDKDAKLGLLFRVARIQEAELEDYEAAELAFSKILDISPDDDIAQIGLEEIKRAQGDADALVDLLLGKVEREDDASARASTLREIGQLYEELEQSDSAVVAYTNALAEEPGDERTARDIERLARTADEWNEVLTTLSEAVQSYEDASDAAKLYVILGRWYAEHLKRPDYALPCFGQALQLDPNNDGAFDGTIELYRKGQSWQELVQVLQQRAEVASNPARARDHRAEAAEVVLRKLNDVDRATDLFQQVLEEDSAHPKASSVLEEIYTEHGRWKDLVSLLESRSHGERGEARVETLVRVAEIHEDRLDDIEKAAVYYEGALEHGPRNVAALKGLERVYARTGKYAELLDNLRTQLDLMTTPRQKIAILERMGSILEEEFVDSEKAAEAFEQIVALEPGHEQANTALGRLYRSLQRFDDLVETLDRRAKAAEDDTRKIELLMKIVRVLTVEVGAPDRAIGVCERVLAIDPNHAEALDTVARLKESTGDATAAIEATEKLAETEKDPTKRAELWTRAGKLLEEAGDKDRAIERFKAALDSDASNAQAAQALRAIYAARGDASGAAELLRREIEVTEGNSRKAELHAELGWLYRERLDDADKAKEAFETALELDPTCTPAGRGAGDVAYDEGDYKTATEHLAPLLARTDRMPNDPAVAREVAMRCAHAYRELEELDKAQATYLKAKSFAPDDREILEKVAEVTFEMGKGDEAAEMYREIEQKFEGQLVGPERGRVMFRRGEALRMAEQHAEAKRVLERAAELIPEDPAPLESIRKIHEAKGDWDDVVRTLRRRMEHADDEERAQLLVQVGDVLLEKVGDRQKAAKSYVAALEVQPNDRNVLTKLMAVYSETKDWSRLVEVILRIAELVDDTAQLAKYYITAASIAHEELGRYEEAADYYEHALDNDPALDKAFDGLVRCLIQAQSWDALCDTYRQQLERIKDTAPPERRAELWDALGETLQQKLERPGEAVEAYEEAQHLDPDNRRRTEMLADIYADDPKRYFSKAVQAHEHLLHKSPYRVESYQALRQLYTDIKRADESWCVCQTLRALKMADTEETAFFEKHRSQDPAEAQEFFNEEIWFNHILHHDQDPLLTGIFSIILPAVAAARAKPLESFGLDPSQRCDPETDPAAMAQTLHYAAAVGQIPLPEVYYRQDDPGGLSIVFSNPPAIGLGQGALAGGPPQALAFVAARHVSFFRPGHYLRHLVPTGSGLRAWLLGAIRTATPQFPVPPGIEGQVGECLEIIKQHVSGPDMDQLQSLVQKLLAAAPELDMKKWFASVDLTADRVGFVLANDLEIASAVIKASPEDAAAVPQKERLKELYLYSVSEAYLQLRHKIGIAIDD